MNMSKREIIVIGWDGRSNPMYRYKDEMHKPDYARSIVKREDLEDEKEVVKP